MEVLQGYASTGRHYGTRFDKILVATTESEVERKPRNLKQKSSAKLVHRLTSAQVSDITARYQQGCSSPALAEAYGVSKTSIVILLREASVPIRRQGLSDSQADDIITRYTAGTSLAAIGKSYGVSAETVRKLLLKQGITLRNPWDHPKSYSPASNSGGQS